MADAIEALLISLQETEIAASLRRSFIAYPLLSALHVAATGGLLTAVSLMHARQFGFLEAFDKHLFEAKLARVAVWLFMLAAISGLLLFSVNAVDYAQNSAFRLKVLLITLAALNLVAYRYTIRQSKISVSKPPVRLFAVTSAGLWISVLISGRFIGFH